ncbi:hypothetical protein SAMN02745751_02594 [Dethiosulfatibacter aminovorans DSM 17477]|uniref:Acid-resistance membrane protein n=1 Tax=Dethiosulfatibacter aminovorans DSM 17477 TaxID=1121476 RepID=A0A1M6JEL5_9FIRM|nr:hypothetical protein [Dethiosulfatibacter aminovorans]SHJ45042.1 hypothetical protein SAMN02745751_02594 [Dethiosulfatibacter aminovorans DSM 17477]
MIRFEINSSSKVLRTVSLSLFLVGLLLISFPSFIGIGLIRVVGVMLSIFCGFGIYYTEGTIWGRDRSFFLVGVLIGILVLVFPELVMIISGLGLLSFGIYKMFFIIREHDYSNKYELVISCLSLIAGIILMFKGRAAVVNIVRIVGVAVISFSAVLFYKTLEQ